MIEIKRRLFLASISITVSGLVSGCLADDTGEYETEGNDDVLIETDPEELAIEGDAIEEDGWERTREDLYDTSLLREFVREDDEGQVDEQITIGVEVDDSVEAAEARIEQNREEQDEVEEYGIASAAILYEGGGVTVKFRDANVTGTVIDWDGNEDRALTTAVTMHEAWR